MTFTQLEYIVAVDTYRHFAVAAGHCFVTQPTLSMQVHKLEKELGLTIFDRSKQPVIPTEAGREIIGQARKVLSEQQLIGATDRSDISGLQEMHYFFVEVHFLRNYKL